MPEPVTASGRVNQLLRLARPIILERWAADSCIASTAIGIRVLRYFGIDAHPMSVRVAVYNALAARLLNEGVDPGEVKRTPGAYGVGVGFESTELLADDRPHRWPGHLAILLDDAPWLIDLALDPASRPAHDMPVEPTAFPVDDREAWLCGEAISVQRTDTGVGFHVWACPTDRSFRRTPGWIDPAHELAAGAIIRAMRAEAP
jgi:hypothetical protein